MPNIVHGDSARSEASYDARRPLSAEDIAECILLAVTRPVHVCLQRLLVTPTEQAAINVCGLLEPTAENKAPVEPSLHRPRPERRGKRR